MTPKKRKLRAKNRGWADRKSARVIWRCPDCGDQIRSDPKRTPTCGLCFLRTGKVVLLVKAKRAGVTEVREGTVADPYFLADGHADPRRRR